MKTEELFEAIGGIHSETIEKGMRFMKTSDAKVMKNNDKEYTSVSSDGKAKILRFAQVRKIVACFAAAMVLLIGSTSIAYAYVPSFRELINAIFFPKYTTEEMVAIENGHLTGAFDEQDVLLTFLDKFNQKEWGNQISVKYENGYFYEMFCENEGSLIAFVDSDQNDLVVAVYMKKQEYGDTTGIWQVEGYQVLHQVEAEDIKSRLSVYFLEA